MILNAIVNVKTKIDDYYVRNLFVTIINGYLQNSLIKVIKKIQKSYCIKNVTKHEKSQQLYNQQTSFDENVVVMGEVKENDPALNSLVYAVAWSTVHLSH